MHQHTKVIMLSVLGAENYNSDFTHKTLARGETRHCSKMKDEMKLLGENTTYKYI